MGLHKPTKLVLKKVALIHLCRDSFRMEFARLVIGFKEVQDTSRFGS